MKLGESHEINRNFQNRKKVKRFFDRLIILDQMLKLLKNLYSCNLQHLHQRDTWSIWQFHAVIFEGKFCKSCKKSIIINNQSVVFVGRQNVTHLGFAKVMHETYITFRVFDNPRYHRLFKMLNGYLQKWSGDVTRGKPREDEYGKLMIAIEKSS